MAQTIDISSTQTSEEKQMARNGGSAGSAHSTRQKGLRNRTRRGVGTYKRLGKAKRADHYDRPALRGHGE